MRSRMLFRTGRKAVLPLLAATAAAACAGGGGPRLPPLEPENEVRVGYDTQERSKLTGSVGSTSKRKTPRRREGRQKLPRMKATMPSGTTSLRSGVMAVTDPGSVAPIGPRRSAAWAAGKPTGRRQRAHRRHEAVAAAQQRGAILPRA